MFIAHVLPFSC